MIVDHDVALVQVPRHIWLANELRWNVVTPLFADPHQIDSTNGEALNKRVDMNIVAIDQQLQPVPALVRREKKFCRDRYLEQCHRPRFFSTKQTRADSLMHTRHFAAHHIECCAI